MNCTIKILGVAVAGGIGTLARYGLASLVQHFTKGHLPWGTIVVNILGCFVFGLLWTLMRGQTWFTHEWRAVVFVGFMGAFTTFSSYIFETGELIRMGQWFSVAANIGLQNVIGLLAFGSAVVLVEWWPF
ncbi:MAG: CrcB family protein [Planctomycetia bacterium]|jgi:CrcB protein